MPWESDRCERATEWTVAVVCAFLAFSHLGLMFDAVVLTPEPFSKPRFWVLALLLASWICISLALQIPRWVKQLL